MARMTLIIGVYADDLIITSSEQEDIDAFKREMTAMFHMSDLGMLGYYLGIEVEQSNRDITLCKCAYAKKLLEQCGMGDYKPCQATMEEKLKLLKDNVVAKVDTTRYRNIVGGMRYLTHTRPDISFAVGYVSRFMEEPQEDHLAVIKHLLRYIAGTCGYGIVYSQRSTATLELSAYSDSDMVGDVNTRQSTTGVMFFLSDCPVSWQSQKQRIIALSTCEAEYIAAATASCQGTWLRRLLQELTGEVLCGPVLRVENKSAIALARNPVLHDWSKDIDIKYHYIRDCIDGGCIKLEYVETARQFGDILTQTLIRLRL
ncbi:uncharacterized mitochondrial protein AtMg00810-like [Setaria viridis]|uniref:uncharacterized mitochondrial protein AtMg00810-like n=1 Tax=Setaria viridis TaxID=4556 RepID=UPI001493DBE5|nr:uncharacterized mitochondrial protein AtMg00810-like [Setaria viridis]